MMSVKKGALNKNRYLKTFVIEWKNIYLLILTLESIIYYDATKKKKMWII
jgi:hypothetical protein